VTLLRAKTAQRPDAPCREEVFGTFAELDEALGQLLGAGRFDAVIHAAAVSDYGVEMVCRVADGVQSSVPLKLDSGSSPLLRLRPHPKLVDSLRARSATPLRVVAFKLTRGATAEAAADAVRALFARSGADLVVHNDLEERADAGDFPATLRRADGGIERRCATRAELAAALEDWLVNVPRSDQSLRHAPLP
jgi:phosphopantothenoylcysteine synthetase/decarboxylase